MYRAYKLRMKSFKAFHEKSQIESLFLSLSNNCCNTVSNPRYQLRLNTAKEEETLFIVFDVSIAGLGIPKATS